MATTVTSKGQVTIPKPVRDHLGIGPGSQIAFRRAPDGSIAGPGPSTDEIMAMTRGD
jgi:antitoxin PrlF